MEQLPPEIYEKHWIHSREEDSGDMQVYHPSTYNFPPSRGRRGFEIKKNGQFIQYGIAPDDRLRTNEGQWVIGETNIIRVEFSSKEIKQYKMKILTVDHNTLKIQKLA
jgi:hypothetical protein